MIKHVKFLLTLGIAVSLFAVSSGLGFCYNMTLTLVTEDEIPVNYLASSLSVSSTGDCARECAYNEECSAFFVNEMKECSLHTRPIADLTLIDEDGWIGYDFADPLRFPVSEEEPLELWIDSVTNVSSEYSSPNNYAIQIIGPSDVYPDHGDLPGAWAARNWSKGPEWIMVKIVEELFIIQINLYETFNPGGTKEISAKKPDGDWDLIWTTPGLTQLTLSRINEIMVQPNYATDELWITTDGSAAQYWVEIDAVEVMGWPAQSDTNPDPVSENNLRVAI